MCCGSVNVLPSLTLTLFCCPAAERHTDPVTFICQDDAFIVSVYLGSFMLDALPDTTSKAVLSSAGIEPATF